MFRGSLKLIFLLVQFFGFSASITCPSDLPPDECLIHQEEFNKVYLSALANVTAILQALKDNFHQPGFTMTPDIPGAEHFASLKVTQSDLDYDIISNAVDQTFSVLSKKYGLTKLQLLFCLKTANINLGSFCPAKPALDCSKVKSYTIDGTCNNVDNPYWGSATQPFIRIFPDAYDASGQVSSIRQRETPRTDSLTVNGGKGQRTAVQSFPGFNSDVSTALTQIITHDLMSTTKWQPFPGFGNHGVSCCNPSKNKTLQSWIDNNPWCMPIIIKKDDECFDSSVSCLQYTRLLKSLDSCNLTKPAAPMNFHTSFMDCELFYNPNSKAHRDANGGKYKVDDYQTMMEMLSTYDNRTTMTPILFRIVICYLKIHNIIFDEFKRNFPTLSNDTTAAESQKFVCGAYQATNVNYMTSILPSKFGTFLLNLGKCYDKTLNPQVSVSFAACFRGMHIFMRDTMSTYSESFFTKASPLVGKPRTELDLRDCVMDTTIYRDNMCGITHGCLDTTWNIGPVGPNINCKFFALNHTSFGTDLMSLDQQYDIDSGCPSWASILRTVNNIKKCDGNFTPADMKTHSTSARSTLWQRCNASMGDLGFSIASGMEDTNGEILGPTCSFVIADQVKRFICGDRFFVNHHPFMSDNQRTSILKLNFFNILCLCEDCFGARFQKDPFRSASSDNLKIPCPTSTAILASFNLAAWFN